MLALVVAQWIPFGFNWPDPTEGWIRIGTIEQSFFGLQSDSRPLSDLPWAIAGWLTPNCFLGLNVVLALVMLGRSLAMHALLLELAPDREALAYATAALVAVTPADAARFDLSSMGILFASCFLVVALWLLIAYWNRGGSLRAAGVSGALTLSLGIYEVGFPIVVVAPLLTLLRERKPLQDTLRVMAVWYCVPLVLLIRAAVSFLEDRSQFGYYAGLFAFDQSPASMIRSLASAYAWQLWGSWSHAFGTIGPQGVHAYTAIALGSSLLTLVVLRWRSAGGALKPADRHLFLAGAAAVGLGFVAYLPSVLRDSVERTMIYGSVGGALCLALLGRFVTSLPRSQRLAQSRRWSYAVIIAGLVGLGMAYGLDGHGQQIERARRQETVLRALTKVVPDAAAHTVLLLFDDPQSNELASAFGLRNDVVDSAVSYLYADPTRKAHVCSRDASSPAPWIGKCRLETDHFTIAYPPGTLDEVRIAYDRVVALQYAPERGFFLLDLQSERDAAVVGYQPAARIDSTAPPPPRLGTIYERRLLGWRALIR